MRTLSLGILAHIDAGKTSATERILYEAGVIAKPGKVDEGTTVTDTLEQERRRGITISAAVAAFTHKDVVVNVVDTPGHPDFIAEIDATLDILDASVLVISAVEGVQAQTRILFRALKRRKLPFLIFVNKIDRMGARSDGVVTEIRTRLTPALVPLGRAHGLGTPNARYEPFETFSGSGRQDLIEVLAEDDMELLERFVEREGELDESLLREALVHGVAHGSVHPLLFGSALSGAGVLDLIEAIASYLPSQTKTADGELQGQVFKIERGSSGEKASYVTISAGTLRMRQRVLVGGAEQRVTALEMFDNGAAIPVKAAEAGRIVKVWGFEKSRIGDGVGAEAASTQVHHFARPFLESAVFPEDARDLGRLYQALALLADQDPLIGLRQDDGAKAMYVSLYGEVQKEVIQETLASEFGVRALFSPSSIVHVERVIGLEEHWMRHHTHSSPPSASE